MTKTQSFWIGRLDKDIDFLISVQFNIDSLGFFPATIADYEISNAVYVERGENNHQDKMLEVNLCLNHRYVYVCTGCF